MGVGRYRRTSGGEGCGGVALLGLLVLYLHTHRGVVRPMGLLTCFVAVVGIPATIVLSLFETICALKNKEKKNVLYFLITIIMKH